ncbi:MAG: 6-phosphogluconolactonase [Candidatus Micrarchaeota archaeon]|nr:6-phosphogluconolactonase [Candidatus Micrarchaeota archaeon]
MRTQKKTRAGSEAAREKFAVRQCEPGELMDEMGDAFARWAKERLGQEPFLLVGLAGGRSLDGLFGKARGRLPKAMWRRILFFPVDERIVGPADGENNARHLRAQTLRPLLAAHDIKGANVLALDARKMIKEKLGRPSRGREGAGELAAYSHLLRSLRPDGADLLVLGIGEDGHVASLFPGRAELKARGRDWLQVKNAPKPPPARATIAPDEIRGAKELWLVARGEGKRRALEMLLAAAGSAKKCPARLARENPNGALVWTDLE